VPPLSAAGSTLAALAAQAEGVGLRRRARLVMVTRATEAIEASASPRKP
jgi:hypothetical protein